MQIAFAKKSLRELCEKRAEAEGHLGSAVARKLRGRLSDLRAANSVTDLIAGNPRELRSGRNAQIAISLGETGKIVFSANHNNIPLLDSGSVNWSKVTRVLIVRIEPTDA